MMLFYLWNFKPNERDPVPTEYLRANARYFPRYRVVNGGSNEIMDAVHQFPKLGQLWGLIPHWIVKADIARYLLVYLHGGFYLDVDCEVKKPIQFPSGKDVVLFIEKIIPLSRLGPREFKSEARKTRIANYAFGARNPRNSFIQELIEESMKRLLIVLTERANALTERDIVWLAGPDVVTSVYHRTSDKSKIQLFDESYVDHYAHGSWRT